MQRNSGFRAQLAASWAKHTRTTRMQDPPRTASRSALCASSFTFGAIRLNGLTKPAMRLAVWQTRACAQAPVEAHTQESNTAPISISNKWSGCCVYSSAEQHHMLQACIARATPKPLLAGALTLPKHKGRRERNKGLCRQWGVRLPEDPMPVPLYA